MPAAVTMETAHGFTEAPPKVEEKPEWWASPATLGLFGFGLTTMIAGFSNLPAPYASATAVSNGTVFPMAMAFGGACQFIAGAIALRKGNMFAGTAFTGYGAFWWAFTLFLLWDPASGISLYGVAAFTFVWMLFTLAFLINAPKHGWGIFMVFLLLWIAFILLTVKFWILAGSSTPATAISNGFAWFIGGEIFATGAMAYYVGLADLTNWNYGRKVLPA
jgi:uncharacterized protein